MKRHSSVSEVWILNVKVMFSLFLPVSLNKLVLKKQRSLQINELLTKKSFHLINIWAILTYKRRTLLAKTDSVKLYASCWYQLSTDCFADYRSEQQEKLLLSLWQLSSFCCYYISSSGLCVYWCNCWCSKAPLEAPLVLESVCKWLCSTNEVE